MRLRFLGGWLATALLAGCYTISYKGSAGTSERSEWDNYFLWGLIGQATVDLQQTCPGGVAKWKSQQTFVQGLLGVVTLGIYVPRSVIVECDGRTAMELRLGPWKGQQGVTVLDEAAAEGGR